jgi:hypothetical protein
VSSNSKQIISRLLSTASQMRTLLKGFGMSFAHDRVPAEFSLLRSLTGLTVNDAAEFFQIDAETVDHWDSGIVDAPRETIESLKTLWQTIDEHASRSLDTIDEMVEKFGNPPEEIEWGLPISNLETQEVLGLPAVGCAERIGALVSAECEFPLKFVQRGSTPASRQAIFGRLLGEVNQQIQSEE